MAGSKNLERLFMAAPITDDARERIAASLRPLPGRVVPPENWHFTLRFLGDTPPAARDVLIAKLRAAHFGGKFSIRFDGMGAFPRVKRARIIWLGVTDGAAQLVSLAEKVEGVARKAGFPAESRPFKPHLTLSRIEPPRAVPDVLSEQPPLVIPMEVGEVTLVKSSLGSGPAKYEVIERIPLE